jgi:hypothetical protein
MSRTYSLFEFVYLLGLGHLRLGLQKLRDIDVIISLILC